MCPGFKSFGQVWVQLSHDQSLNAALQEQTSLRAALAKSDKFVVLTHNRTKYETLTTS